MRTARRRPLSDRSQPSSALRRDGKLSFTCNVCGTRGEAEREELERERPTCEACGSTVRWRSVIDVLAREVFGRGVALPEFPRRDELRGIGLSDWDGYALRLAERLSGYSNTFLHQEPQLDILEPPTELLGTLDFVISSDVFEHVPPPVERAFESTLRLLKPGGVLVLTVPYGPDGETLEHFPRLHRWELVEDGGATILVNETAEGEREIFRDLVFHGGEGTTLEMRRFSREGVFAELGRAGFVDVREAAEERAEHGIVWLHPWSLPFVARRP